MEITVAYLFQVIGKLYVEGLVKDNQIAAIGKQVEEIGKSLEQGKSKKGKKNG